MTKILSVEERATMFKEFYCECNGSMTSDAIYATTHRIITEDRNQAYTSLVEGIEELKRPRPTNVPSQNWTEEENINDILDDILENVVKPLYGKE